MESPQPQAWYFFSDDVPRGEVIVPIRSSHGLAFAVNPAATAGEIVGALNQTAEFVLGVGLAHIGHTEKPPPDETARKE